MVGKQKSLGEEASDDGKEDESDEGEDVDDEGRLDDGRGFDREANSISDTSPRFAEHPNPHRFGAVRDADVTGMTAGARRSPPHLHDRLVTVGGDDHALFVHGVTSAFMDRHRCGAVAMESLAHPAAAWDSRLGF